MNIQVEFSLALNNRTGKFYALDDVIKTHQDVLGPTRFWRLRSKAVPTGFLARVLGKLMTEEIVARARSSILDGLLPRMRPRAPVLFTDPLQVLMYNLTSNDIVVVHDLGPLSRSDFYAKHVGRIYEKIYKRMANAKCHLIFVSEASRDEYRRRVSRDHSSMTVIYNPIRADVVVGDLEPPARVSTPFLLAVGAVGTRKNQGGACRGFRESGLADLGYQLVICGGPEPGFDEARAEAERTRGALMLGYANDAELRWLYVNATAFVLPSRLEGFGMPAAEAINRDLLPLLSRDPALMEVAGDAAVYVDAEDDGSIATGMIDVVRMDPADRSNRLARGREGLHRFELEAVRESWSSFFSAYEARTRS